MKLLNADSTEFLKSLESDSIDCIITDPPFGVNFKNNIYDDSYEYVMNNMQIWCDEMFRVMKSSSYIAMFVGVKNINKWMNSMEQSGFNFVNMIATRAFSNGNYRSHSNFQFCMQPILLYSKDKGKKFNNVDFFRTSEYWLHNKRNKNKKPFTYEYPSYIPSKVCYGTETINKYHPNQKSLKLVKFLVEVFTDEKQLVMDPFLGCGTTGVACKLTNRDFLGIEKNHEMFEIAKNRIKSEIVESKLF